MYNYGGSYGSCGCGNNYAQPAFVPYYGCGNNSTSNYAIILVLFILLVIIIGARFNN